MVPRPDSNWHALWAGILNPLCLPISPLGHVRNNRGRNGAWQGVFDGVCLENQ